MITVVIPTLNAEATLASTLAALVSAAVDGLIREVIVVDGGSTDRTAEIAEDSGATLITCEGGRGAQLRAGGDLARFPWLLFLHADTELEPGWEREATSFMEKVDCGKRAPAAAAFRFVLDDEGFRPRLLERMVALRCRLLSLPYGDQGLLLPRSLYAGVGGFAQLALMEDVDLVGRLGRRRVTLLRARAVTSARRYRRDGYLSRSARNLSCLALYFLGVPPATLARRYDRGGS
ncbi:MAG TPA: TIGR04283 family arsenosugar biosynthesis glycosyltransferase [Hyphomicrobiaceae bacterium]|nr:TIGR04283 family arsenosugar biosynthesis glycosyltransferase [Hyphomicrobiaceae bacterium]